MGKYTWIHLEYTCDQCGKKHKNGDRMEGLPPGWISVRDLTYQKDSAVTNSTPNEHFCCVDCLVETLSLT